MTDDTPTTNGHAACHKDSTRICQTKRNLVLSIVVILFAISVAYFIASGFIKPTKDNNDNNEQLLTSKSNNNLPIKKIKKNLNYDPKEMTQFIEDVLNLNLDDFVTIEQLVINLRDLLRFNNVQILPRISSIVTMDLFKFVKFNLNRPCNLWTDMFSCTKKSCNIQFCDKSKLPKSYLEFENEESCPTNSPKALSKLDQTLSQGNVDTLNVLFECSRDDSEDSQYYDLIRNPERYTGYDGHEIWQAIYKENCFATLNSDNIFSSLDKRCYEERVFYRSISGLHTSITTHLTALHHKSNDNFGPNPSEYFKRFFGKTDYIKNLFFIYLIELRAFYKIEPYLLNKIKWNLAGDKILARDAIKDLLKTEKQFKWHFNEDILFKHEFKPLAAQIAAHFHNITFNIIDCVSCDKCRLWGKVQTNGLGTAFKILLTENIDQLRLSHHEITCLLNSLARLSFSVSQISNFRSVYQENNKNLHNSFNSGDTNFLKYID